MTVSTRFFNKMCTMGTSHSDTTVKNTNQRRGSIGFSTASYPDTSYNSSEPLEDAVQNGQLRGLIDNQFKHYVRLDGMIHYR